MLTFGHAVMVMMVFAATMSFAWLITPRPKRQTRERSPWLTGLLDAEAGEAVEPQDWDDGVFPGWWQEYAQGAFDYRRHLEERLS